jgi:hypothetical protein
VKWIFNLNIKIINMKNQLLLCFYLSFGQIAIAQEPPKMTLDAVEDITSAIFILEKSVSDYKNEDQGGLSYTDYRVVYRQRDSLKSLEFILSLQFKPGLLLNKNAITYTARYDTISKKIHFYELERGMYIVPGKGGSYKPSKYLTNHQIGFSMLGNNEAKLKDTEKRFMALLQKNQKNTQWLTAQKALFIQKEHAEAKLLADCKQHLLNLTELDNVCLKYYKIDAENNLVLLREVLRGFVQVNKPTVTKMLLEVTNSTLKENQVSYAKENFVKGSKITLNYEKELILAREPDWLIVWDKVD